MTTPDQSPHEMVLTNNLTISIVESAPPVVRHAILAVMTPEQPPSQAEDRAYQRFLDLLDRHDPNAMFQWSDAKDPRNALDNYKLEADVLGRLAVEGKLDFDTAVDLWAWSFGTVTVEQGLAIHEVLAELLF